MRLYAALFLSLIAACGDDPAAVDGENFDVLLKGGSVFSGVDEGPNVQDVGVRDGRIAAVGNLADATAPVTLDVSGLAVTPGFIDIHNHAIRSNRARSGLEVWPAAENLIRQGVTTAIGGPDGGSPLPIEDTFATLEAAPGGVNFATFVGAGSVRAKVVGPDDRPPTAEELELMRAEVEQAMRAGAFGLSSGLIYAPGSFATTEELVELARVAARYDGIYISHMRNEGSGLLDSIAETIRIGEEAGLPAQITHFKAMGKPNWGRSVDALAMVDAARARGVDVTADQYPYPASSTGLTVLFPRWARDGDRATRHARYEDPVERARISAAIVERFRIDRGGNDPARVAVANCAWNTSLNGLNLAEVMTQKDIEPTIENAAELVIDMQQAGGCTMVYHAMHDDDVARIMVHPATMIASDGGVEAPSDQVPHPRNYGAFARVLGRYVREQGVMPLHTAIHKMTRMPADRLGLDDRGRIEVGAVADIAVFDAAKIIDHATFDAPHQYATGVVHVFVNGVPVLRDGDMTGARPGVVIRSSAGSPRD